MTADVSDFHALKRHVWTGRRAHSRWLGRIARGACLAFLILLACAIAVYVRMTNPSYVRSLAQDFFARFVEADVTIGDARLSIFDGLQLDEVVVNTRGGGKHATALSAKRLKISYSPLALLTGRLESGQVIAIEPQVYLTEDVQSGKWNLQSLQRPGGTSQPSTGPAPRTGPPPRLPQVLIRGGSVIRAQDNRGKHEHLQTVRLEGQLLPRDRESYQFNLQTRTAQGMAGPAFQGEFSLTEGAADSSLTNVQLAFLEPLLPARVRAFWRMLEPTGRVNVPVLSVRGSGEQAGFRIELELDDVKMVVHPSDWASAHERRIQNEPGKVIHALSKSVVPTLVIQAAVGVQPVVRKGSLTLDNVRGRFAFTEEGVTLGQLSATLDGNAFDITGRLGGYAIDAPMRLTLASPPNQPIILRPDVPYINSLPAEMREVYYRFRPQGRSNVSVTLARDAVGDRVNVGGELEFADANFVFEQFKYPVKNASGKLIVDNDPQSNEPRLIIDRIGGRGAADGPNASGTLAVNGIITPLIGYSAVDVEVSGKGIHSEPALIEALPPEAREVIAEFDDDGDGPNPVFQGDFLCRVKREPGAISRWTYDTDIHIVGGRGALREFPFPFQDLSVDLLIRKEYVQIDSARFNHGGGTVELTGLSEWGQRVTGARPRRIGEANVRTNLLLKARNLPIDDTLRVALPAEAREQLIRYGIGGTVDVTGPITVSGETARPGFDLTIEARDARFAPVDWKTTIDAISATMQLTPDGLKIDRAVGQRGAARLAANGQVEWSTPASPTFDLDLTAANVALDESLRDSLPVPVRTIWNTLRPEGSVDGWARLKLADDEVDWSLELKPLDLSLHKPDFLPMPITQIVGTMKATPSRVELDGISGHIAGGTAQVTGVGEINGPRASWTLKLKTAGTVVDAALIEAMPDALGSMLTENAVAGQADLEFRRLDWTTSPEGDSTVDVSSDIVFDVAATLQKMSWQTGVAFDQADGTAVLRGHFIDDEPADLEGDITLRSFRLAGIEASEGSAVIRTDAPRKQITVGDVRAKLADGDLAGSLTIDRGRPDVVKWQTSFLLRNADVGKLTADSAAKLSGRLNASLGLEGGWPTQPDGLSVPRRGRGDIAVSGRDMVNVPMVLGVTQMVSLALPFTGGFNEATASYSIDAERVSFSDITLQSSEMRIKGAGWLDFEEKQVNLDFYTDSTGKKLPVIGNLLDAARRELFQIKVRGTLAEPTVKAGSLRTITATVDEILNDEK
jgi:AsmA-like C-terminal region